MNRPNPGRRRAASARLACLVLVLAAALGACGKKGPPLAPLLKVPARVEPFAARRFGSVVYLQARVPTANGDGTSPASVARLEIYGFTGAPADLDDFTKRGTLVATIPVRRPLTEDEKAAAAAKAEPGVPAGTKPSTAAPAPPPRPPASMENGFDQGDTVLVTEPIGPAQLVMVPPKPVRRPPPAPPEEPPPSVLPLAPPPAVAPIVRVYVAIGVNKKGQRGAASARVSVPMDLSAPAPDAPTVTFAEDAFIVDWTPPPGLSQPVHAPATGGMLAARMLGMRSASGAFDVYEVPPPSAAAAAAKLPSPPPPGATMPVPLNEQPLVSPPFVDRRIEFGTARCYVVRSVTSLGSLSAESDASPATCVTPRDTFPPAAPKGVRAVGGEGAISLIWDANTEADLAGYLVLRAPLAGGEQVAVTPAPIADTTFRDATVQPGVRYAYVIVAVDKAGNRSAPSARVEEAAR